MARIIILFISSFWLAAIGLFNGNVSLNMRVPQEVNAGKEFLVDITLNKSDVQSFARFQQDLPQGFSVEVLQAANADYRFEENKVKFVWLNLPENEELNLIYKVKVNEKLKGKFNLSGKFSYISDNERKHVQLGNREITIIPSSTVDPNLLVDVNDFKELVPLGKTTSPSWNIVSCIRQAPFLGPQGNELLVNILVNKGNKEKFAKIEEKIPDGFTAENVEAKDGIFTFKSGVVKFLWMNLPSNPNYIVSYKLIPNEGTDLNNIKINGSFSFIEKEETQSIEIVQREADLLAMNPDQINSLANETGKRVAQDFPFKGTSSTYSSDANDEGAVNIPIEYVDMSDRTKLNTTNKQISLNEHKLTPDNGVYYRVQIAAGHKLVNIPRYFKKYKFKEDIKTEQLDGWIKYSVGSFVQYVEARDYRNIVWNEKGINDAFVSAYNNGTRITVQEALMISNQKWYK